MIQEFLPYAIFGIMALLFWIQGIRLSKAMDEAKKKITFEELKNNDDLKLYYKLQLEKEIEKKLIPLTLDNSFVPTLKERCLKMAIESIPERTDSFKLITSADVFYNYITERKARKEELKMNLGEQRWQHDI